MPHPGRIWGLQGLMLSSSPPLHIVHLPPTALHPPPSALRPPPSALCPPPTHYSPPIYHHLVTGAGRGAKVAHGRNGAGRISTGRAAGGSAARGPKAMLKWLSRPVGFPEVIRYGGGWKLLLDQETCPKPVYSSRGIIEQTRRFSTTRRHLSSKPTLSSEISILSHL